MNRLLLLSVFLLLSCRSVEEHKKSSGTYGHDLNFLQTHDSTTLELKSPDGNGRAIVSSRYQGRVMTSTSAGIDGTSYGWINYGLIESGKVNNQFNPVGGEERLWLGPEGGQFSLYFAPGDSFNINDWQVPPILDTIPFTTKSKTDASATFEATARLTNYSGTVFDVAITRKVELMSRNDLESALSTTIEDGIKFVGYRTVNEIGNAGSAQWTKETGLISIWLLGMFTPSPATTVIIPFQEGTDPKMISTNYFGDIPPERLTISDGVLFFKCDGKFRSKIGLPPSVTRSIAGSYDLEKQILTLIVFEVEPGGAYVNSKWEIQSEPFYGDAVNAYNDGPLADGSQLGPFYELESSSPAMELWPKQLQTYAQVTCHFEGDAEALNKLLKTLLHTDINELNDAK